ncbi:hypothetical protein J437_LFUL011848 [Ladona fulva]|uniref:NHR domain-containing protein n=1 Tax=Ladona fulva TaxID=123851 RepID=A0A8K0K413_LADFU|nr:hypothetical protein J437_LFUL011848 [Ladona fulva]
MVCQAFAFVFIITSVKLILVEGGVITSGSQHSCKLLLFHEGASRNAVVTRNSTHMLNDEDDRPYTAVWTNRHLNSNELFEVNFERMENARNESIYLVAIGVTNITHDDINNIQHIEPREWMMQWIIKAEDEDDSGFQKFLKSGIKFGVMRTEEGNLDIFVNGVNEGTISQGVPKSVYGVIEFLTGGLQATIVGSSSTSC